MQNQAKLWPMTHCHFSREEVDSAISSINTRACDGGGATVCEAEQCAGRWSPVVTPSTGLCPAGARYLSMGPGAQGRLGSFCTGGEPSYVPSQLSELVKKIPNYVRLLNYS